MATWVSASTVASGYWSSVRYQIAGGYGTVSRSGTTVSFNFGARVKRTTSAYTTNGHGFRYPNSTSGTMYHARKGSGSSGTWYYASSTTAGSYTSEATPWSYSGTVSGTGSGNISITVGWTDDWTTPAASYSGYQAYTFSVPYPAQTASFNLNILAPDGSEPYTTGEAGTCSFSSNGGSSYTTVYNEPASSYTVGTVFYVKDITPGTGMKLSSVSGVTATSTSGTYSGTLTSSGMVISIQMAWQTYTISYNANGGSGAPSSQTKTYGTALTLSSTKPTRSSTTATGYTVTFNGNGGTPSKTSQAATNTTAYTFSSWNTASGGTGTSYAAGASYTANAAATLYAQWSSSTTKGSITTATATRSNGSASRVVTINANGGSSTVTSRTSTATITYSCNGWYTATSGGTKRASSGGSYTPTATETVYAQWTSTTGSYSAVTLPTATECTRSGYKLLGFATSSTTTTAAYSAGASYTPSAAVTLYAVWELEQAQLYTKTGGSWVKGPAYVKVNGSWVMAKQVYTKVNGTWVLNN